LLPALDGGEDSVGIGGPDKGLRLDVVLGDVENDG
jgi:hypothetical protein